ncbi:MAG: glycosyltransferase family 4 protein [Hyphomicrobiaceae bacterium]
MLHKPDENTRQTILFVYLGRFGALGRFTLELADAAASFPEPFAQFVVSANNDIVTQAAARGLSVRSVETFSRPTPLALTSGYLRARRQFIAHLDVVKPQVVVNLMAHVWSPLLTAVAQARGVRVLTVVHDAVAHPGDPTARINQWLLREARRADGIVTLSEAVAHSLADRKFATDKDINVLFHPDLRFGAKGTPRTWAGDRPLRLLFFGRIMAYKGLDLLVEAVEDLRQAGVPVELAVAGSGEIGARTRAMLNSLGAEVINRWIGDEEITPLLERFDAVACAHIEASQSGVAATAFAHAMPVIAMPTGGIVEQVVDGETGVLAKEASRQALSAAIARLAQTPELYNSISAKLVSSAPTRSMRAFLKDISQVALRQSALR